MMELLALALLGSAVADIGVAVIALVGVLGAAVIAGPVMWKLNRFDKKNTDDHLINKDLLTTVVGKVERIDEKLDDHIAWHVENPQRDAVVHVIHGDTPDQYRTHDESDEAA